MAWPLIYRSRYFDTPSISKASLGVHCNGIVRWNFPKNVLQTVQISNFSVCIAHAFSHADKQLHAVHSADSSKFDIQDAEHKSRDFRTALPPNRAQCGVTLAMFPSSWTCWNHQVPWSQNAPQGSLDNSILFDALNAFLSAFHVIALLKEDAVYPCAQTL